MPATTLPGGVSGGAGVRVRRRRLLGVDHGIAELGQGLAPELLADLREVLLLLFLHVVAHVLDEDGDLGVEALVVGVEVVDLREHPLDDVVLLEALEHDVLGLRHGGAGDGVEEHLLDGCVLRQLLADPVGDLALVGVGAVTSLLEALEELLHGPVVVLEQGDGIHAVELPERAPHGPDVTPDPCSVRVILPSLPSGARTVRRGTPAVAGRRGWRPSPARPR
nr:hypothetical protein [Aquihabitans sp. G128]